MMTRRSLATGDRVRVIAGRWIGRAGEVARWDLVYSGQTRSYPVIRLDATARARTRDVRVVEGSLTYEPEIPAETPSP